MSTSDIAGDERVAAVENELKRLVVEGLGRTDLTVDEIDSESPMFKDGIGLDSMDLIELQRIIGERFGFEFEVPDGEIREVFASVRVLAGHLVQRGAAA